MHSVELAGSSVNATYEWQKGSTASGVERVIERYTSQTVSHSMSSLEHEGDSVSTDYWAQFQTVQAFSTRFEIAIRAFQHAIQSSSFTYASLMLDSIRLDPEFMQLPLEMRIHTKALLAVCHFKSGDHDPARALFEEVRLEDRSGLFVGLIKPLFASSDESTTNNTNSKAARCRDGRKQSIASLNLCLQAQELRALTNFNFAF